MKTIQRLLASMACLMAAQAGASFHLWKMTELYSNADGTVQYLELAVQFNGEQFVGGMA